jgi:hypothetical protein
MAHVGVQVWGEPEMWYAPISTPATTRSGQNVDFSARRHFTIHSGTLVTYATQMARSSGFLGGDVLKKQNESTNQTASGYWNMYNVTH